MRIQRSVTHPYAIRHRSEAPCLKPRWGTTAINCRNNAALMSVYGSGIAVNDRLLTEEAGIRYH